MSSAGRSGLPLRYPDVAIPRLMGRRAWWLVVLGIVLPGSAQIVAGRKLFGRFGAIMTTLFWALVVLLIVSLLLVPAVPLTVLTTEWGVLLVQAVFAAILLVWAALALNTLIIAKLVRVPARSRIGVIIASVAVLALMAATFNWAGGSLSAQRALVAAEFRPGLISAPSDGRYNIMLLGGDAGADREGLRPDSLSVISIDAETGATTTIGIPRDLSSVPLAEDSPLVTVGNPCGSACQINAFYSRVMTWDADLYPNAAAENSDSGIEATRDAVEGATGLEIQYYALVDMGGFEQLINSLGGVTIEVPTRTPIAFHQDSRGNPIIVDWFEPGVQTMDGTRALTYARVRYGTSDYDRMARQRQVQDALIAAADPWTLLTEFTTIAPAVGNLVRTDVPQGAVGTLGALLLKARDQPRGTLELVPPLIDPADADYDQVHQLVQDALTATPAAP